MENSRDTASSNRTAPGWVFAVLLVIAIGYQTFENIRSDRFYLTPDKMHHILSSQAFLKGFGMSHLLANPEHPGELVVVPHTLWSTGYSLVLAGALSITGNLYQALALVDLFSTVLFFSTWWLICAKLERVTGKRGRLFLLGWWALAHSPLSTSTMDASGSSDMLAIGLFSLGILLSIRVFDGPHQMAWVLASGACFGAAAGVRYAYWPLIAAGPMALAAISRGNGLRGAKRAAAQVGTATVFVVFVIVTQPSDAVHTIHDRVERGLYWSQLSTLFPFPANAIGIFPALRSAIGHFPSELFAASIIPALLWVLSAAIVGIAFWGLFPWLRDYFRRPVSTGREAAPALVVVTTAAAMGITVALLCYLTVRVPADGSWTYGSMPRYYMPAEMFLFIGLAAAFERVWSYARSRGGHAAVIALASGVALFAAGPMGLRIGRISAMVQGIHPASPYTAALRMFQREIPKLESHGLPVVYADSDYERVLLAGMAGARMLRLENQQGLPALDNAEALLVTAVRSGASGPERSALAARMAERGAKVIAGTGSFDLVALDLSKLPE